MHQSILPTIVQESLGIPNTPAAYYGLGMAVGAVICVIAWFVRDQWVRRSARNRHEDGQIEAVSEPATTDASTAGTDAAKQKAKRKLSGRELMYIAGVYIGTEMIARGAKGIFPAFPADALVWGVLTGFVLCLMILIGLRNGLSRKSSSGEQI